MSAIPLDTAIATAKHLYNELSHASAVLEEHLAGRIGTNDPKLVELQDRITTTLDAIEKAAKAERGGS